jgi:RNA polymerase sigma factor (sigma-70 family)
MKMGQQASKKKTADYTAEMDAVTVRPPRGEVLMDPHVLADVLEGGCSDHFRHYLTTSPEMVIERWEQLERLRCVAARKLAGKEREIVLLLLGTGCSQRQAAKILGISRETVRHHLAAAQRRLKEHALPRGEIRFPAEEGDRYRVALFPLDTEAEQRRFCDFINEHGVCFLAYGLSQDFREVLAIHT